MALREASNGLAAIFVKNVLPLYSKTRSEGKIRFVNSF